MANKKKLTIVLVVIMMVGLFGCGQKKYKLELDGYGLSSKESSYAEGSLVKVIMGLIATDTNYSFYLDCDDTELKVNFENEAYVITFRMPAHDVKLSMSERNTMVYVPLQSSGGRAEGYAFTKEGNDKALIFYVGAKVDELAYSPLMAELADGGNHAQFASYGTQKGDKAATISPETQVNETAEIILRFAEKIK